MFPSRRVEAGEEICMAEASPLFIMTFMLEYVCGIRGSCRFSLQASSLGVVRK
jgi:hypothetical protein